MTKERTSNFEETHKGKTESMKTLDTEEKKIQKICDAIRKETLEPVQVEASTILDQAQIKAQAILDEAKLAAKELLNHARDRIEQEKNVFHSSLLQATKQSVEALKQEIESKLFNRSLEEEIQQYMKDPQVIAKVIDALIAAVEKEGRHADLKAQLPKTCSSKEVAAYLSKSVLDKLHMEASGDFIGGAEVILKDKKMTLEMSDEAVKELLASFVRKDFRTFIFS